MRLIGYGLLLSALGSLSYGCSSRDAGPSSGDSGANNSGSSTSGGGNGAAQSTAGGGNNPGGSNAGGSNSGGSGGARSSSGGSGNPTAGASGSSKLDGGGPPSDAGADGSRPESGLWVLGYWAVWQASWYPMDRIRYADMTHIALSFVLPRAPATPTTSSPYAALDTNNAIGNLGATGMSAFTAAAHAGGVKALMSLGGGGAGQGFADGASSTNRAALVSDVLAACKKWNFDGVDVDWEDSINFSDFKSFVHDLRAAAPAGFLITVPIGSVNDNLGIDQESKDLWSTSYGEVDQLNVMTYVGSGNYPGWVVWYFSPLFGAASDHPFDVSSTMDAWHALGIPKSKLGLGIGFYGRTVGPPVTAALQDYGTAQVYGNDDTISSGSIQRNFIGKGGAVYHFDDTAKAPWLGWSTPFKPAWSAEFPNDAPPTVQFLTYEDATGVAEKGKWAKANGYGGAIIWTINEGVAYPDGSDGYANPMLDAVNRAFR